MKQLKNEAFLQFRGLFSQSELPKPVKHRKDNINLAARKINEMILKTCQ